MSRSILEGPDEILTVTRLGLPLELRRSLASANIIESMNAVIRQACRNAKRWRDARVARRRSAAGMPEAERGFRRLKAHKPLSVLRAALEKHRATPRADPLEQAAQPWARRRRPRPSSTSDGTFPRRGLHIVRTSCGA